MFSPYRASVLPVSCRSRAEYTGQIADFVSLVTWITKIDTGIPLFIFRQLKEADQEIQDAINYEQVGQKAAVFLRVAA
jgi:hypothetical protein